MRVAHLPLLRTAVDRPSFHRSWLLLFQLLQKKGIQSIIPCASIHDTSVRARLERLARSDPEFAEGERGLRSRAVQAAARTIPCAAGPGSPTSPVLARWGGDPRADAPRKPGFGLLGRNASERAKKGF